MSEQYVYFIQADENGPIKIGYTADDPKRRLSQLQTGNASTLKLLGAVRGTSAHERKFHADLAEWRLQGEWFEPHPTVISTIQDALASSDVDDQCIHCSFCLRCHHDTEVMLRGLAGNICDDCIRGGFEHLAARPSQ